jgi:hypothetical protein
VNVDLKRRIGRDFIVDHARHAEAHREAFWHLLKAIEAITEDDDSPALEAAVESALTLLEYHDWSQDSPYTY